MNKLLLVILVTCGVIAITIIIIIFALKSKTSTTKKCVPACSPGETCVNGNCVSPSETPCVKDTDCPGGCCCINPGSSDSFCTTCRENSNCPIGKVCINNGLKNSMCVVCNTPNDCKYTSSYYIGTNTPDLPLPSAVISSLDNLDSTAAIDHCNNIGNCTGFVTKENTTYFMGAGWPDKSVPDYSTLVKNIGIKGAAGICQNKGEPQANCVQCLSNSDCPSNMNKCDVSTGTCVECNTPSDCAKDETCMSSRCVKDPCEPNGTWNPQTNKCDCETSWKGPICQYSDKTTCSGHGSVNDDGLCTCDSGWKSANCSIPANTTAYLANIPACNYPSGSWLGQCQWTPGSNPRVAVSCNGGADYNCCSQTADSESYCAEVITTTTDSPNCWDGHKLVNCYLDKNSALAKAQEMCSAHSGQICVAT